MEVPNPDEMNGYSLGYGSISTLPMYESQVKKLKRKRPVGFVHPKKVKSG